MNRWTWQVAVCVAGLGPTTGCMFLSGDWQSVSVMPDENEQTIAAISFDPGGGYTVTVPRAGQPVTFNGRYSWNGMTLSLRPDEGQARSYGCILYWGQSLILKDESQTPPVTVMLRRR